MRTLIARHRFLSPILALAAVPLLASPTADRFVITSCSLGCTSDGVQVICATTNVYVNEEIRVGFSDPVAPSSVTPATFRILDVATGIAPEGSYRIDPVDPSVVVFSPKLSFGPTGVPSFGFRAGGVYQILIPGLKLDPSGPHIESLNGLPVWQRLLCTVAADQGVLDPVPGPPVVYPEVQVLIEHDGLQTITAPAPAEGATRVALDTDIVFAFDDVMNLGSLITPITGVSTTVLVGRSPVPGADPVPGSFSYVVDPTGKTTTLTFDPDQDLLSGETLYVDLSPAIVDLVGNSLTNAGTFSFTTEP